MKTPIIIFALLTVILALPTAKAAWEVETQRSYQTDKVTAVAFTTAEVLVKGGGGNQSYALAIYCGSLSKGMWIYPSRKYVNLDGTYHTLRRGDMYSNWVRFDKNPAIQSGAVDFHNKIEILPGVNTAQIKASNTLTMGLPYYKGEVVLRFDLTGSAKAFTEAEANCK